MMTDIEANECGGGYVLESSETEQLKEIADFEKSRNTGPQPIASTSKASTEQTENIEDYIPVVLPKGQATEKLVKAFPYNMFLTAVTDSKPTHYEPLTITFLEILDESLGEIEMSLQINFIVDINWLLNHYYFAGILEKPLTVLYGYESEDLETISQSEPQVTAIKVDMSTQIATFHAKIMLFAYTDGPMRVVISTANLYELDWHNHTNGLWISPKLTALPADADTATGESPTGFRTDLLLYLVEHKLPALQPWMARIKKTDFSDVNVFFIGSLPSNHREGNHGYPWGHAHLGQLLAKHSAPINDNCSVVCQSSSIGTLGPNVHAWIQNDILSDLRKNQKPLVLWRIPTFKMIYPSYENVKSSHDKLQGANGLMYRKRVEDKQPWLKEHLHQWKSNGRHRSQAMPHIKSYTRWSDEGIYWFVLTSANLSKVAWGAFNNNSKQFKPSLRAFNYEAGVLFLPKFIT